MVILIISNVNKFNFSKKLKKYVIVRNVNELHCHIILKNPSKTKENYQMVKHLIEVTD